MAISRSSLTRSREPEQEEVESGVRGGETPDAGASAETASDEPTGRGARLRFRRERSESAEPVEPEALQFPPAMRPSDQEKVGYISPNYDVSRPVTLDPRRLEANRCVGFHGQSANPEAYRQLRTRIQHRVGDRGATIMVTSAQPGEGKTLTAINLSLAFARDFRHTALLVDCDLRSQQVHKVLGFSSDRGLVDYLLDDAPVTELFVWPGVEKLTVISGGRTVNESCELLSSPGMQDLVQEMKHRYPERYVIFDAPPLLTCADAIAFAPLVDYVLVVTEAGRTSQKDLDRALALLPPEKVLGLVLNRC